MTKFTNEQVTATLEAIVEEFGEDYRPGDSCLYGVRVYGKADVQPHCIVGHLVHRLDKDAFHEFTEGTNNWTTVSGLPGIDKLFSHNVIYSLRRAQNAQDNGQSWGDALIRYFDRYERNGNF